MNGWTNEEAIRRWPGFPREALDSMEPDGDFGIRDRRTLCLQLPHFLVAAARRE